MTNCDRKSHITNMGATDVMPESMAKTTSEGLGVLPEMMPKMALERNSPKHDMGIMERLKGEGKRFPSALSNTAWGTTDSRATAITYSEKRTIAEYKSRRSRYFRCLSATHLIMPLSDITPQVTPMITIHEVGAEAKKEL